MSFVRDVTDLEGALEGEARYADVALALIDDRDRSTLLYAGGRWDMLDRRFSEDEPEQVATISLEVEQVKFVKWFADYLRDYREGFPRDVALVLAAGARRGGKTFVTYLCQIAALLDVPLSPADRLPTIGWTISRTYRQRDELDQIVAGYLPPRLYEMRKAPEHQFKFPHGSYLRNLSADDPESLKQGRVDFLLYNEGQMMTPTAIRNGMYGTADRGGLTVMAANPPTGPNGEWLRELKEAIDSDAEMKAITRYFFFDAAKNTKVDQPARRRIAAIAKKLDPDVADADSEGSWDLYGKLAYPGWTKDLILERPPAGADDVTGEVTRLELHDRWSYVIGGDFQRRPQAAAVLKVYRVPGIEGNLYHFVDEVGVKGTEVDLSTALLGPPHSFVPTPGDPRSAVWIGDCSGSYQGAERIPGRTSFSLLEGQGWKVHPAEIIRILGRSEHPKNPDIGQRLGLMERLMRAGRIIVSPSCTWLIRAFKKCELRETDTGRRIPKGRWAHVTDAASYAVWRLEPRVNRAPFPKKGAYHTVDRPKGLKVV